MPPPVGHRPGIAHMPQVPPATNVLTGPAVSAATAPSAQPDVTKPLFPSAGQVKHYLLCATLFSLNARLLLSNEVSIGVWVKTDRYIEDFTQKSFN